MLLTCGIQAGLQGALLSLSLGSGQQWWCTDLSSKGEAQCWSWPHDWQQQREGVPGSGALLVMNPLLIPLAPAPPATLSAEMNGDGQGRAGSSSGSLKTERRKTSQPAFFFVVEQ